MGIFNKSAFYEIHRGVYEPDMQAFGILDLQLLHRYMSPGLNIEAPLKAVTLMLW